MSVAGSIRAGLRWCAPAYIVQGCAFAEDDWTEIDRVEDRALAEAVLAAARETRQFPFLRLTRAARVLVLLRPGEDEA